MMKDEEGVLMGNGRYRWLLVFMGVALFGICAKASDPLNYAMQSLDPEKLYNSDSGVERVDLFRGGLHLEHTDVHLPGKYGLDVNLVRWYNSKISDTATSTGGTCQVFDYGQETGEILGYGWRMHMGRFYQQTNPVIPAPGVAAPNPADYLELPGGRRIAFYVSADNALFPGSNGSGQRMGAEFWWATYPTSGSHDLVVHAPDGTIFDFDPSACYTVGTTVVWNVTTIQRGNASITIAYDVTPQYAYMTTITDTYGRQLTFHYYDANDPSQLVNPLYEIDFPVAGTAGSMKYYYINPSSSPVTQDSTSNPTFTMPTLSGLTSPVPRYKTYGPPYFILGQVVPPAGTAFATSYNYFLDAGGGGALAGNQMACIQYPNGTISAFAYSFISRPDFPGESCYVALTARGKKGNGIAGQSTPISQTRRWTYGYSVTGSGNTSLYTVQVNTPKPVRKMYYFNPFVPLTGVSCPSGNCPANNNWQRWRVGLLLKEETWDTSSTPVKREDTAYTYDHAVYDSQRFPYANTPANFLEHGYSPVLAAETQTLYLSGGQLAKTTTFGTFDQYGNPGQKTETGYSGSTLRTTVTTYAWSSDTNLKNEWAIRAPEDVTVENGSSTTIQDVHHGYYDDTNHPGFPSMLRRWVSDDGAGSSYWSGEDYAYSSSSQQDTVTTTVGHTTSRTGSLTVDRKIIETQDHGTPVSRVVQGPSGFPSIQVYSRTLDSNFLAPVAETVDGTTHFQYDSAGRLSGVTPPSFTDNSGTVTAQTTTISYTANPPQVKLLVGASFERTDFDFDGFGALASKRTYFTGTQISHADTAVDALGRTTDRYVPYFNVGDKGKVTTTYDALNRPLTVTAYRANGTQESQSTYSYSADTSLDCLHVTVTRPASAASGTVQTEEWYDSDGNLTQLVDDTNNSVYYTYDALDDLTEIQQGSQTRSFSYASTGQLLSSTLPESGTTHLVYDHAGNLTERTFADNSHIQYTPDFAGRVTQITFADNSKVKNVYDTYPSGCSGPSANPSNHLLYQSNLDPTGGVIRSLCNAYDSHGRLYKQTATMDNTRFTVGYDYNDRGELTQILYPSGQAVQATTFNEAGLPANLGNGSTPIVWSLQYGPDKNLLGYDAGASVWSATDDTFNRPVNFSLKKSSNSLYQSALSYYPSGSLSGQSLGDSQGLGTVNVAYQYDDLHRLAGETLTGAVSGSLGYTYDAYGNLKSRTAAGGIPNASALSLNRSYGSGTNRDSSDGYDGRGNVTTDGLYTYTPNALNMAATAAKTGGLTYTYSYDPDGRRVRNAWTDSSGNNYIRYAFYDGAGELLSELQSVNGGAITPVRDYIYASGRLVAIQDFSPYTSSCSAPAVASAGSPGGEEGMEPAARPAGVQTFWAMAWDQYVPSVAPVPYQAPEARAEAGLTYEYPVLDVTGTPRMWVDNLGNVISRGFAGPYGEDLGFYHDQGFTALGFASLQDNHQDAGVFYTPNRYLGTAARFLSADPSETFNVHDPRTLNQYAYVMGDPLLSIDPKGLDTFLLLEGASNTQEGQRLLDMTAQAVEHQMQQELRSGDAIVKRAVLSASDLSLATSTRYPSGPIREAALVMHASNVVDTHPPPNVLLAFTSEAHTINSFGQLVHWSEGREGEPWSEIWKKDLLPFDQGGSVDTSNFTKDALLRLVACDTATGGTTSLAATASSQLGLRTSGFEGEVNTTYLCNATGARINGKEVFFVPLVKRVQ